MKRKIISISLILILGMPASAVLQKKVEDEKYKKAQQRYQYAQQLEIARKYEEAFRLYQQLWDDDKKNFSYYQGVKRMLITLERYDQAMTVIGEMLKTNQNPIVESDLGEIYYKLNQKEKAFYIWDEIIHKHKKNLSAYQAVANLMINNRLYDEAIAVYQIGRKNIADKSAFLVELATLFSARLDYKNATQMYLEYLEAMPEQFTFVEAQLISLAKNIEEFEPIIEIVIEELRKKDNSILLRKLLAELYIRNSNYALALDEYKYIDQNIIFDSSKRIEEWEKELFDFGMNALNDGKFQFSKQAFEIFISRYPSSPLVPKIKIGLAEAEKRNSNFSRAIEIYEQVTSNYPGSREAEQAYLEIGDIKLNSLLDPIGARESFSIILKKFAISPVYFEAMFKISDCEIRMGNFVQAKQRYQQIFTSNKASTEIQERAKFKLAEIDFWEKNFDSTLNKLDQIINTQTIIRNYNSGFYVNDALSLSIFITENRQHEDLLKEYVDCLLLIEQRKYNEALSSLKQLQQKIGRIQLAEEILLRIGEIECKLNSYSDALVSYRSLIEDYPESYKCDFVHNRIGDIYLNNLNDPISALKEYELILAGYPESLLIEDIRKKIRKIEKTK